MQPFHYFISAMFALFLLCIYGIIRFTALRKLTEMHRMIKELKEKNNRLLERNTELMIMHEELGLANEKLQQLAVTDGLTGCYNRRYLNEYLKEKVISKREEHYSFSILLFDIDLFKTINDTYGHLVGDEVLKSTADTVKRNLRKSDMIARYGGEEFTVFLPYTTREQAMRLAQRIHSAVEANVVHTEKGPIQVTISIGLITIDSLCEMPEEPKECLNQLFSWADSALYQAKHEGRNQIVQGC